MVKAKLEDLVREIGIISPNILILGTEYLGGDSKVKCKCLIDNHEWEPRWRSLKRGSQCPKCSHKEHKKIMTLTLEEIKERLFLINPYIEIISKKYLGANEKIECRCLVDNHIWVTTWSNLSKGTNCPKCSKDKSRLTLEEITLKLEEIHPHIELESTEYINANTKLDFHCTIDDYRWAATWGSVGISGRGCQKCGVRRRTGKNSSLWKGGLTPLQNHLRSVILPWKKDSRAASNYKCVITGGRFGAIHHLYGFDLIVKETMDIVQLPIRENISEYTEEELKKIEDTCLALHYKYGLGICLKKTIHDEFHFEYGRGGNLPEQFEKFLKEKEMVRIA